MSLKKLNKFSINYVYFKLMRQTGSPESIARGVAIGLFVGMIIPIGPQMITALVLAVIFKAQKIPAMASTWLSNYLTVPVLYPAQCYLGSVVMGAPLTFQFFSNALKNLFEKPSAEAFFALGKEIMMPFFVGGFVSGSILAFFGYFAAYGMVVQYRKRRKRKLNRKLAMAARRENN